MIEDDAIETVEILYDLTVEYVYSFDPAPKNMGVSVIDTTDKCRPIVAYAATINLGDDGKDLTPMRCCQALHEQLEHLSSVFPLHNIKAVLVEKQIPYGLQHINGSQYACTRNLMIETILLTWFCARGLPIVSVAPTVGVTYAENVSTVSRPPVDNMNKKQRRAAKKAFAVACVDEIASDQMPFAGFSNKAFASYNSMQKKDDVADSILQCLGYLAENN
jgi:hypothetical protein